MKLIHKKSYSAGFTLVELLVSMVITVILVGILVYMTSVSMDSYRSSRDEVRASRQAKEAIDIINRDFEGIVMRRDGRDHEWLYAGEETSDLKGPSGKEIPNTSRLMFFTAATDRYNGQIGQSGVDNGGDISAVSYRLVYRDQILDTDNDEHAVFSLYRNLVDPDEAFDILASEDLLVDSSAVFSDSSDLSAENFLVENIYEFTITFIVKYDDGSGNPEIERVVMAQDAAGGYSEFILKGNTIELNPPDEFVESGDLIGAEISLTVLTDQGMTLAKRSGLPREEILKKHSYHFTKKINMLMQ